MPQIINTFEHRALKSGAGLSQKQLEALQKYYGSNGTPFYSLIHNGIKFNSFVGVIQIGTLIINVLPKIDNTEDDDASKTKWRNILIGMLKTVKNFELQVSSSSLLNIKENYILDIYFELFIKEVEYLLHNGLYKKYNYIESNSKALKGKILFSKNINKNIVHKERFFVRRMEYNYNHIAHKIIYKTLKLLHAINNNNSLNSRISNLMLNFPEVEDIKVSKQLFDKLILGRKLQAYKKAINISKMLLLNFHPDITRGQNDVLALMFDMNILWEEFVYTTLKKNLDNEFKISRQINKNFWNPDNGGQVSRIRPDILIENGNERYIIDTKWKKFDGKNPSVEDLRQLYVYHKYFNADKVSIVHPGMEKIVKGKYYDIDNNNRLKEECSIISIPIKNTIGELQKEIKKAIFDEWIYYKKEEYAIDW